MSTRYRHPDWERDADRYGRDDDDRGRYERGPYERGSYGGRELRAGRVSDDYGYLGGAYGGGAYGRGPAGRDYGRADETREYGRADEARDYRPRESGPRYGREGDFIERGYERSHRRADEGDDRGGYQTDYGRTSGRFFGRRGQGYDPDDYNEGYGPVGYDRRTRRRGDDDDDDDRREYRRGEGGRNWIDRAADEVRSWFGGDDDDDSRRRQAAAGRYRGRGPRNYRRSDDRVRDDINDRLTEHDWLDASDVEVSVVAGEVTLTGSVESRHAKRLAEDIAESVSGVTHVQNNLRVNSGWEVGMGRPAVDTAAVGDAGATGLSASPDPAGTSDLTGGADVTTPAHPSSRAAGRGQS